MAALLHPSDDGNNDAMSRLERLKIALASRPTDESLNKEAALEFEDVGDFDGAISCWIRIAQQHPNDQEPRRVIGHLLVQKTIRQSKHKVVGRAHDEKRDLVDWDDVAEKNVTLDVKLRREIDRKPEEVSNYVALADYFWKQGDFEKAESIMQEAVNTTGNIRAREYLEDVQMQRARRRPFKRFKPAPEP